MFRNKLLFLKKKFASEYVKNVSVLLGGSGVSQIILLLIAPIITRLYLPEDIGMYELFTSMAAIVVSLGTLQYDLTVYTAETKKDAMVSFCATSIVIFTISLLSGFVIILIKSLIVKSTNLSQPRFLELAIPLYVYFACSYNLLITWFTKFGKFKFISIIRILLSVIIAISQVTFGFLNWGYWGLMLSSIFVQFITFVILFVPFFKDNSKILFTIKLKEIVTVIKTNYQMPLLVLPGDFINNVTQNLPAFFLNRINPTILGYYSLSRRIIGIPLNFISNSFRNIFIKEASDEFTASGIAIKTFRKNLKIFIAIGIILSLGIVTLSNYMVPLIFGEQWRPAVPLLIILSISYIFRFIVGTLSFIMILGKKSRLIDLLWQGGMFVAVSGSFLMAEYFNLSPQFTVLSFCLAIVLFYSLYCLQIYRVAAGKFN